MVRRCIVTVLLVYFSGAPLRAWGTQGHQLIGLVAARYLGPVAQRNVVWLLEGRTLADVGMWADQYRTENAYTDPWHYVDIPAEATSYVRDRDCARQRGVQPGSRADKWRDCIVDRILYNREQLASTALDRADRAIALKFLVHLVADLHQPMHAIDVARGGNDIPVVFFGSPTCTRTDRTTYACNLHGA